MINELTTNNKTSLLTPEELASQLNTSRMTVYRFVKSGLLPCYRLRGGIRFNQQDVNSFLNKTYSNAQGIKY